MFAEAKHILLCCCYVATYGLGRIWGIARTPWFHPLPSQTLFQGTFPQTNLVIPWIWHVSCGNDFPWQCFFGLNPLRMIQNLCDFYGIEKIEWFWMAKPFKVLGRDSASATAKCLKRAGASPRRKRQVTKPPGKQRSDGVKWWGFTLKLVPPRYVWWLMIVPLSIDVIML